MLLPKHTCENIDYYTTEVVQEGTWMYDIIVIHFKQWWKRKRVIKFRRQRGEETEKDIHAFYACTEYEELNHQLRELAYDTWVKSKITSKNGNVIDVKFNKDN